jgi:streptogramin lyase
MPSVRFLLSTVAVALVSAAGSAHAATISEFPFPPVAADHGPLHIAASPTGNLWFSESLASSIGTSTRSGAISETSGLSGSAYGIAIAPGGDVWATEPGPAKIAHLTPGSAPTQFSYGIPQNSWPVDITAGPNGNMWFTQWSPSRIGKITPGGTITEFSGLAANTDPTSITAGPDGNLWFTESGSPAKIGRITPSGTITQYATGLSANADPSSITAGPDGNLWFTESGSPGKIGRITPSGTITQYATGLSANADPSSITAGADGNLWFTESTNPGRIARITPGGTITEYTSGLTANSDPSSIVAGADGNLWFTEQANPGRIGRLTPDAPSAATQAASAVTATTATLAGTVNPNSAATTYHFDFGTTTAYGQRSPAVNAVVGADTAAHAVTQSLTGLLPGTTYHCRVVATSGAGTTYGSDAAFTTPAQPSVLTSPPPVVAPARPAPPALGRTAVASVVSGTVLVRLPGSSRPVALGAAQNIPLAALVNVTHGVVKVTNAIDTKGHTQAVTMWAGSFTMAQARTGRGMTTIRPAGAPHCPTAHGRMARAMASKAPVRLWSKDNHGRYSTRGRNSVATVRGTLWETIESCSGTRTVVKQGRVSVRDLHRHTTIVVRTGHSYLARP